MNLASKYLTTPFIVLLLSSLLVLTISPLTVQAVTKPSIPQFTVKLIDNSYDVPAIQIKDPYTGEVTTQIGYRINKISVMIEIEDLPDRVYYRVQYKGRFEENWTTITFQYLGYSQWRSDFIGASPPCTGVHLNFDSDSPYKLPPSGAQLDFRVQALYAVTETWPELNIMGIPTGQTLSRVVETQAGDWSGVQTITITYDSSPPSHTQTPSSPLQTATTSESSQTIFDNNQTPITNILLGIIALLLCVITILALSFLSTTASTEMIK